VGSPTHLSVVAAESIRGVHRDQSVTSQRGRDCESPWHVVCKPALWLAFDVDICNTRSRSNEYIEGNKMVERLTDRNFSTASAGSGIGKVIAIDLQ
jgi:hypothetical protein